MLTRQWRRPRDVVAVVLLTPTPQTSQLQPQLSRSAEVGRLHRRLSKGVSLKPSRLHRPLRHPRLPGEFWPPACIREAVLLAPDNLPLSLAVLTQSISMCPGAAPLYIMGRVLKTK